VARVTDHIKRETSVEDADRENSVSFNGTTCTTKCWGGSSCPRNPMKGCGVMIVNTFLMFMDATYGGPCGSGGGAWWNVTEPSRPSLHEVCRHHHARE
jgi:hypothetical protein